MIGDWKKQLRNTWVHRVWRRRRAIHTLRAWTRRDDAAVEFYSQVLKPGELCYDIGANVGNRLKVFRKIGARVLAVEPQPSCASVLRAVYGGDPMVDVLAVACGETDGYAELHVGDADTIATMSEGWMDRVISHHRFGQDSWSRTIRVPVTTLDHLIAGYGVPSFIKIDVEGFEESVLAGLNHPIKAISFEFTPEYLDATASCLTRIESLGQYKATFSLGESLVLDKGGWTCTQDLLSRLERYRKDTTVFGDVFVRRIDDR
jgi:FkbM family methyltransferase